MSAAAVELTSTPGAATARPRTPRYPRSESQLPYSSQTIKYKAENEYLAKRKTERAEKAKKTRSARHADKDPSPSVQRGGGWRAETAHVVPTLGERLAHRYRDTPLAAAVYKRVRQGDQSRVRTGHIPRTPHSTRASAAWAQAMRTVPGSTPGAHARLLCAHGHTCRRL